MCSIGVMLGSPDERILKKINQLQSHRGPMARIFGWMNTWSMAHNRLAIVDVSGSSQPIISDEGVVLVHNGEIYNNSKIKNETVCTLGKRRR